SEILGWKKGTILNLGQKIDKTCEVFVNGGCAGRGFPVEYENRVGARVQDLRLHK
ncbi:MAG: FliM/FliN family flagellar motor switch protein, partial [Thermoguttaceae bacterium]|nr:FliM/FliN family flagellar motor switch protein [Thermoguttaceae bacterium]